MSEPTAIEMIAAERRRQIAEEGWTPGHDDHHGSGELAQAAAAYAMPDEFASDWMKPPLRRLLWPWHDGFKPDPHNRVHDLVRAGALIVAEIERLQRKATP